MMITFFYKYHILEKVTNKQNMSHSLLKKIHELKAKIDAKRPLTETEIRELRKWYDVSFTYNSNAIEGNTLTLAETKIVIEDGLTVGGKQIHEILEAKNHKTVLDLLFDICQKNIEMSEDTLFDMHKHLLFDIDEENAGVYRKVQVYISGSEEKLPSVSQVSNLMKEFFQWYKSEKNTIDPVMLSILVHYKFVKIHPFIDGNGRMARLMLNLVLIQNGFPPIIVPVVRRLEYIQSIKSEDAFTEFLLSTIYENLKDYVRMIEE